VVYLRVRSEVERLESRAVSLRQRVARIEGELDRAGRRRELAESEAVAALLRLEEAGPGNGGETRLSWVSGIAQALKAETEEMLPLFRRRRRRKTTTRMLLSNWKQLGPGDPRARLSASRTGGQS